MQTELELGQVTHYYTCINGEIIRLERHEISKAYVECGIIVIKGTLAQIGEFEQGQKIKTTKIAKVWLR